MTRDIYKRRKRASNKRWGELLNHPAILRFSRRLRDAGADQDGLDIALDSLRATYFYVNNAAVFFPDRKTFRRMEALARRLRLVAKAVTRARDVNWRIPNIASSLENAAKTLGEELPDKPAKMHRTVILILAGQQAYYAKYFAHATGQRPRLRHLSKDVAAVASLILDCQISPTSVEKHIRRSKARGDQIARLGEYPRTKRPFKWTRFGAIELRARLL